MAKIADTTIPRPSIFSPWSSPLLSVRLTTTTSPATAGMLVKPLPPHRRRAVTRELVKVP
jgi:hypothetical protein